MENSIASKAAEFAKHCGDLKAMMGKRRQFVDLLGKFIENPEVKAAMENLDKEREVDEEKATSGLLELARNFLKESGVNDNGFIDFFCQVLKGKFFE